MAFLGILLSLLILLLKILLIRLEMMNDIILILRIVLVL